MKIKAQIAMAVNLDKCIGCHTCSITCKNTWTNRSGTEYMYFNNVETKPGTGYPKDWENQNHYKGGWTIKNGQLELLSGSKTSRLLKIFYHPEQPELKDYYEPWTYDYETLIHSKRKNHQPIARPRSIITGKKMDITWGPNWDDDLAGGSELLQQDYNLQQIGQNIVFDFNNIFMKYLPRTCNHCLNPACVAACPSGAIYKREEDGIVLIDQDACRGWRHCISSCPYKKVFFNWQTNKAEKCIFCFPRIENGLPMICADTCAGRMRYAGVLLYDLERIKEYASVQDKTAIYEKTLSLILDPNDPAVQKAARQSGLPEKWLRAAQESPVYQLVKAWRIALPLHPEFRTLPMVWYVPPLSPLLQNKVIDADLPTAEDMRIPISYLSNMFTAGDKNIIRQTLQQLLNLRNYMKSKSTGITDNLKFSEQDVQKMDEMYHLLAIAKYKDRFCIPSGANVSHELCREMQGCRGFETGVSQ